jgi:hypothetical protein
MSNDFHSLLSVFHDALSSSSAPPSSSLGGGGGRLSTAGGGGGSHRRPPPSPSTAVDRSAAFVDDVEPGSASDPSFSAPLLKERIERLLRVRQIREMTSSSSSSSSSGEGKRSTDDDGNGRGNGTTKTKDDGRGRSAEFRIAICATIVDEFPHEALWRKWMDETGGEIDAAHDGGDANNNGADRAEEDRPNEIAVVASAEMFVHAKHPERVASGWLR